jgi:CheY-like chemotaxis protein
MLPAQPIERLARGFRATGLYIGQPALNPLDGLHSLDDREPESQAAVRSRHVHVLLADVAMPREDGYSLIRRVRALEAPEAAAIPAAALTSFAREEDRQEALDAGFQLHLTKPIDTRSLVEAVVSLAQGIQPQ